MMEEHICKNCKTNLFEQNPEEYTKEGHPVCPSCHNAFVEDETMDDDYYEDEEDFDDYDDLEEE